MQDDRVGHFIVFYQKRDANKFTMIQLTIPKRVGSNAATAVHFRLFVSFQTVIKVVEHGECMSENSTAHIAVTIVQPLDASTARSASPPVTSVKNPPDE